MERGDFIWGKNVDISKEEFFIRSSHVLCK